ncbi:hypothetical protein NDU88_005658 [Pleurodeles waltl]|uniref:Uncharacterized protein n=1 Tax=Pleurodeles waltl TaxID=8319 RepID=A0AAV7TBM2_PLEWA|nr:hypothetical protein NDU88_005658 [Pleurodeles waltl]
MVECPGGALMSIALLQCNNKKNQEVNAWAPKEARVEWEDAEDQRKRNDRTETAGEAARQNEEKTLESLTLAEAEEDDNDRVPLTRRTVTYNIELIKESAIRYTANTVFIV